MEIVDTYEPKFEGMEKMEQKRLVTAMETVLSKDPLDTSTVGYQPPEPKDEPKPRTERKKDEEDKNEEGKTEEGKEGGRRRNERKPRQRPQQYEQLQSEEAPMMRGRGAP